MGGGKGNLVASTKCNLFPSDTMRTTRKPRLEAALNGSPEVADSNA